MSRLSAKRLGQRLGWVPCALLWAIAVSCAADGLTFNGGRAFEDLRRLVALGPRPSGSRALEKARQEILRQLRQAGVAAEEERFVASTPAGSIPMVNVIAKIPGARRQVVIVAGHYETKRFDDFAFVGANDGGSSAAFLLEMARVLATRKNSFSYWVVFFDGEEAFQQFTETDGLYGSRHLVQKLTADGELSRVEALILVDMIGDARLNIHREGNSTPWLTDMVFRSAQRLGYDKYFQDEPRAYEDDHIPFVNAGVAATDLLDFDYGPSNRYWHTAQDTLDKCSATSLTIIGRVVLATLDDLEKTRLK
jgi:glutaminyl-peptide cyclotransferase